MAGMINAFTRAAPTSKSSLPGGNISGKLPGMNGQAMAGQQAQPSPVTSFGTGAAQPVPTQSYTPPQMRGAGLEGGQAMAKGGNPQAQQGLSLQEMIQMSRDKQREMMAQPISNMMTQPQGQSMGQPQQPMQRQPAPSGLTERPEFKNLVANAAKNLGGVGEAVRRSGQATSQWSGTNPLTGRRG
jgi:hypothetical protein